MELYAKGQLSYLILTCLQERDFYGLDIISEISNRSKGRIHLKKPSVYSNLTRMEKQGYISSYLQSSDFGPNRKYYSLTEKGKNFHQELKSYFEMNNIDVFRDFQDNESEDLMENTELKESKVEDANSNQDDFFDFSSLNKEITSPTNEKLETDFKESNINKHQEISFVAEIVNNEEVIEKKTIEEPLKDDAVFLSSENVDEYNKRIYDISKDINRIKRKRSFADDQIAMTATEPLYLSNEKIKSNIEDFKNSILENKEKYQVGRTNSFDYFKQKECLDNSISLSSQKNKEEEIKDDAKFITKRIDSTQVERAKKIEPPKLKIVSENTKDTRLPAPNRDKTIDISHKEILNELYSRTKDVNTNEVRDDAIYDYNDLADYYKSQNISFNIYEKNMDKSRHNTNKLYFINSLIIFLLSTLASMSLYLVFNHLGITNYRTNFLYILLPALLICDVIYKFFNHRNYSGWIPSRIKAQWQVWLEFTLSEILIVGLNFAFGMASKPFELFATTLILPLSILILMIPVRYYLKRLLLVKFWR